MEVVLLGWLGCWEGLIAGLILSLILIFGREDEAGIEELVLSCGVDVEAGSWHGEFILLGGQLW